MKNNPANNSFRKSMRMRQDTVDDLTQKVLDVLRNDTEHPLTYGMSVFPEVFANVLKALEPEEVVGLNNSDLDWSLNKYYSYKIGQLIPDLEILHNYCVVNDHTREDDNYFYIKRDMKVCYIPTHDEKKRVIFFSNHNVEFVCLLVNEYETHLHIRKCYPDLFSKENYDKGFYSLGKFDTVDDLREGIKGENGLEIALTNLHSAYTTWSDVIPGVKYPSYISLSNMIEHDFGDGCAAFSSLRSTDASYVVSYGTLRTVSFRDFEDAKYIVDEVTNSFQSIPEGFKIQFNRIKIINDIMEDL